MVFVKKLFFVPFIFICFFFALPAAAQTVEEPELVYDLASDSPYEQLVTVDEEGNEVILTIEKLPSFRANLAAGTYRVSKTSAGNWTASYNVTVNSRNQFTGTSNLSLVAHRGSITSSSLTHTSTKATCTFKQKAGIITTNGSVVTTISNGKLVVK
ncbi:DUF5626 family protein [Enterococcus casseliflavus]|uniref:DUF5626 family protein n=1 Tax=Enterococcus casseliflavus TaxID=37734 RepID=UPI001C372DA1|nr:DUF5626 family protein [Enterococcus faecium]